MPQFRKLQPAEIVSVEYEALPMPAQIARDYDALLAPLAVGDYGMAEMAPDETSLGVRRRLNAAAARRGWQLVFQPMESESLVFQVQEKPPERSKRKRRLR